MKAARKGWQSRPGSHNAGNKLKTADEIHSTIGFGEAGVPVGGGQNDLRCVACGIKDTQPHERAQLRGNLGTKFAIREPEIQERKIRLMTPREVYRFSNRARDAANVVTLFGQDVFCHVSDHEIVFNDQNFKHTQSLRVSGAQFHYSLPSFLGSLPNVDEHALKDFMSKYLFGLFDIYQYRPLFFVPMLLYDRKRKLV
jgi:hypothetical protein